MGFCVVSGKSATSLANASGYENPFNSKLSSPVPCQLLEISAGTIVPILRQSLANAIAVHIRFLRQKNVDRPASQAFVSMLQVARPRQRIDGIDCVANCMTLPAQSLRKTADGTSNVPADTLMKKEKRHGVSWHTKYSGRHMECACYFD
jgi:hypothetical protein